MNRNERLDILARGSDCPRCGAYVDTPCHTPNGRDTLPHMARIDRATRQYRVSREALYRDAATRN